MAKIKIVPKADMKILRKYISDNAVVLIDESILSELTEKQVAYMRENDGQHADYGFGGEADILVDLVKSTDHMFMHFLFPEKEEER